jgi:hypothetical protein
MQIHSCLRLLRQHTCLLFTTACAPPTGGTHFESNDSHSHKAQAQRPPVLTPPWRYRRSLVSSKGRFAMSINVVCVGICSGLPKRRYRVVVYYVGDLLRHRGKAGCWLFRGLWLLRVCEFEKTLICLWGFVVVATD